MLWRSRLSTIPWPCFKAFSDFILLCMLQVIKTGTRELQFPLPPSAFFSFPLPLFSPVLFCLLSSLPPHPARSTRCSLAFRMVSDPGSLDAVWMVKMQWERVEAMFMGVYIGGWEEEKRNTVGRLRKGSRWRGRERNGKRKWMRVIPCQINTKKPFPPPNRFERKLVPTCTQCQLRH